MLAQRATQQSLRKLAGANPSLASRMVFRNVVAPMAVGSSMQLRPVATQKMTPADSHSILVAQRKLRPTSPHLTIYRPQIPWILSALNRITGCVLSGGFYVFGAAYLVAPVIGLDLSSASMAAAFAAWPLLLKISAKFLVALPFTFHGLNGLRHLLWDVGKTFKNSQVIQSGWAVVGLSFASALGLVFFL